MSKLDMSLDEISKKSNAARSKSTNRKKGKGTQKKGKGGRRGGRGRGRGRRRGRGRGRGRGRNNNNRYGGQRKNRQQHRTAPYARSKTPTMTMSNSIAITNLDPTVTEDDVREIFQKIGKVKNAVVHYDANGRSRGSAKVTFNSKAHAIKAVNEYHQAEVDGRPMYVKAVAGIAAVTKSPVVKKKNSGRGRRGRSRGGRGRGRGRGRGKGRGGRGRSKSKGRGRGGRRGRGRGRGRGRKHTQAPSKTAEQLDKEMEEYHAGAGGTAANNLAAGQPDTSKLFSGEGEN